LEKTLKDSGDKIPVEKKSKIEAAIADAKKDLESNDGDRMKTAMENLSKVGAELYADVAAAAQAAGAASPEGAAPGPDAGQPAPSAKKTEKKADVVDADFEVVDEDKNKK